MVVRMVQFVRLWRKLGWSMRDLDRAITAFRPNRNHVDITDEFLIQLSHVQRLHHELNMPVIRLFAWWAEIDRGLYIDHGVPGQPRAATLYDQLFRNKAVINPPDPAFTEDPSRFERQAHGPWGGHRGGPGDQRRRFLALIP